MTPQTPRPSTSPPKRKTRNRASGRLRCASTQGDERDSPRCVPGQDTATRWTGHYTFNECFDGGAWGITVSVSNHNSRHYVNRYVPNQLTGDGFDGSYTVATAPNTIERPSAASPRRVSA